MQCQMSGFASSCNGGGVLGVLCVEAQARAEVMPFRVGVD